MRLFAGKAIGDWLRAPMLAAATLFLLGNDGLRLDTLLRDFEIVAFGAEYDQKVDGRLHKWVKPIRYYLDIRAGEPQLYRDLTTAHLARLSELSGLPIDVIDEPQSADVIMVFDRSETLVAAVIEHRPRFAKQTTLLGDALCFASYDTGRTGEILRGVIGIPTDRAPSAGKLPACIVEETTQMLGLPNDSSQVNPSIFNDKSVLDDLSAHDRVLVQLLYDERLPVGATRDEVMATAREILRERGY